jgi:hypothetical protein
MYNESLEPKTYKEYEYAAEVHDRTGTKRYRLKRQGVAGSLSNNLVHGARFLCDGCAFDVEFCLNEMPDDHVLACLLVAYGDRS